MESWKEYLLLTIFIFSLNALHPQHSDSSHHYLSSTKYTEDSISVMERLKFLYQLNSYEDAVSLAQQYVDTALLKNDSAQLANMLLILGIMQENKGDNNQAFATFLSAYALFKSFHDPIGTAISMDHLGRLFRYHGSHQKSLEYHTKAYEIFSQGNYTYGLINVLNNLGIINRQLGNDTEALEYHKQALSLALKNKSQSLSSIYISIGTYYWYKGVNDSALYYYNSALNVKPNNLPLKERHCAALNNIGNVYRSMLQYDSALHYYNMSIEESIRYQTRNLESVNLKNLGRLYTLLGQYDKAFDFFQRSLQIATEINLKKVILENYYWLGELLEKQQDYKNALVYFKKYSDIEHEILDEKQLAEINQLERDFSLEQADKRQALKLKEDSENNLLIQKKRTSETIYIALLLLLVSSSLFIFFQYKTKKKSNLRLIKLNEELEAKVEDRTKSLVKTKENAEESKANISAIIEGNNNSIWAFNQTYQLLFINQVFQKEFLNAFGILLEVGMSVVEALPESQQAIWKTRYDKVLANEQFTTEDTIPTDKGTLYIQVTFNPIVKNGQVIGGSCFGENITARKLAEIELIEAKERTEASEERLELVIKGSNDAPWDWDFANKEIYYSPQWWAQIGYTSDELTVNDQLWFELTHPEDKEGINAAIEKALKTNTDSYQFEFRIKHKLGHYVPVLSRGFISRDKNNNILRVTGSNQDLTNIKKTEADLIKAKEKAEESDRLKSAFLANMSHEIRTPMNGILGFTSLLKDPGLSGDKQKQFIQIIEKSGNRMLNTINDIIDISKIEAGQVDVILSEINLDTQLDELYEFFLPETNKKDIRFSVNKLFAEYQTTIISDKEKLNSILTNFIKNAIKYTHHGHIDMGCYVHEKEGQKQLEFYVKDTGIGIPNERQEAIFERFVQADIEDRHVFQGSGLGLAISKAYAEMLGGKIEVESKEGVGSQFNFSLPYKSANSPNFVDHQKELSDLQPSETKIKNTHRR